MGSRIAGSLLPEYYIFHKGRAHPVERGECTAVRHKHWGLYLLVPVFGSMDAVDAYTAVVPILVGVAQSYPSSVGAVESVVSGGNVALCVVR